VVPDAPGLFGLAFRFRPTGGVWRYGDRFGSDDGFDPLDLGVLSVPEAAATAPLKLVTLNLRCRADDWVARKPLLVTALARIQPDLVALQEDCLTGDVTQAEELIAELGTRTRRGYRFLRAGTHTANHTEGSFEEGVALLSAHPIEQSGVADLPFAMFPRKALWADVTVRGVALRYVATHLDYGADADDERAASAAQILTLATAGRSLVVAGDMNSVPGSAAHASFSSALVDLWARANPSQAGLTYPAPNPSERIDYVFAPAALANGIAGARLLDESSGGVALSDHFGVAAALAP
jgi:endonuclease/exonuclease/phosphatase family metal-dependent hydrolase